MTTATKTTGSIDFETRLALADAGITAILDERHGDALEGTRKALRQAEEAVRTAGTLRVAETRYNRPNAVLAEAARIIRERGWARDTYEAPDGAVCAMEAINLASAGRPAFMRDEAVGELLNRIAAHTGTAGLSVMGFNDRCTEAGQVLRLLG